MKRSITALLLVLLIQCGIVAIVHWPAQEPQQAAGSQSPVALNPDTVDEILIGDEYDNQTVLKKVGTSWLLPELEGLPADPEKVDTLLHGLTDRTNSWPVASSTAARQRFQVADYYYRRHVTLLGDGRQLAEIYLGTSPGFRKVYARHQGGDEIYSIEFNAFDAPGASSAWLDPRLLQIRTPLDIAADSYSLHLKAGNWVSGSNGVPDERELEALITALRDLQVSGVAGQDLQRELAEAEAELVIRINSLAGESTLELFAVNDQHFIHSSEYPLFFKVSAYDFERLTGIDERLISGETSAQ